MILETVQKVLNVALKDPGIVYGLERVREGVEREVAVLGGVFEVAVLGSVSEIGGSGGRLEG